MRRLDIINSIIKVQSAIVDSKINEVVMPSTADKNRSDPEAVMDAFQKFSNHYSRFGDNEKKILEIFGLKGINSAKLWASIVSTEIPEARQLARPYYRGMAFIIDYLAKMIDLFKQDDIDYVRHDNYVSVGAGKHDSQQILTVILPESKGESSNPERLITILASINDFYNSISILEGHKSNDLGVIAIDSGSDKSFDFLGAATIVTAVKDLVIGLWDRVVFFREKKLHERIELITQSLPVIEKINAMEQSGQIEREQAELLRRNIFDGAKGFIKSGAILPEFESHSSYNPRQLMAPEPKLLTMPEDASNMTNAAGTDSNLGQDSKTDNLSSDERELLKKLLERESKRKSRKKRNG
jgi:hypothetical protein